MMRGLGSRPALASLLASGCMLMLVAAHDGRAQVTAGPRLLTIPGCQPTVITPATPANDSNAKACSDASNGAPGVFNTHNPNTDHTDTSANTREGKNDGAGPDGTADGASAKPQRKTILSRSWRQIFPRAN